MSRACPSGVAVQRICGIALARNRYRRAPDSASRRAATSSPFQGLGRLVLDRLDAFGRNASPFPIPSMADFRHLRLIATGVSFAAVVRADRSS